MSVAELSALLVICHVAAWAGEMPFSVSTQEAGGRAGPEVIKAEELPLRLVSCSTREIEPKATHKQHSGAVSEGVDGEKLILKP